MLLLLGYNKHLIHSKKSHDGENMSSIQELNSHEIDEVSGGTFGLWGALFCKPALPPTCPPPSTPSCSTPVQPCGVNVVGSLINTVVAIETFKLNLIGCAIQTGIQVIESAIPNCEPCQPC